MTDQQTKPSKPARDDRGPGAEKVELEKRLDRNAELEERAASKDGAKSSKKPTDR